MAMADILSIYPRLLIVPNGLESSEFCIMNTSKDDTVLLYRIHRSEPKLVSYKPKKGIIEPGHQAGINIKFIDPKITLARVLVKVVEINRSKLGSSFNASWDAGLKSIVKKVVEIRNATYCLSTDIKDNMSYISESFRTPSEKDYDPMYAFSSRSTGSISSSRSSFTFSPRVGYSVSNPSTSAISSPINHNRSSSNSNQPNNQASSTAHPIPSQAKATDEKVDDIKTNSTTDYVDSIESDIMKLKETYNHDSDISSVLDTIFKTINKDQPSDAIELGAKSLLMGLGMGLGASLRSSHGKTSSSQQQISSSKLNTSTSTSTSIHDMDDIEEMKESFISTSINEHSFSSKHSTSHKQQHDHHKQQRAELMTKEYYDVAHCSSLNILSASDEAVSLLLLIQGQYVDNALVYDAMKMRLVESIRADQRIAALEISNAPMVDSISQSVAKIFDIHEHDTHNHELSAMRGAILRDHLRHLTITSTKIQEVHTSLNHFVSLSHIDLSSNHIRCIQDTLHLPKLTYLNLSHNQLTSLDFLQELISLRTLIVSSNILSSFKAAINVLVPLAGSLQVLDMSFNPICSNLRYAEHVLSVLPYLKYFDAKDLDSLRDMTPRAFDTSMSKTSPSKKLSTLTSSSKVANKSNSSFSKLNHNTSMDTEDEFTLRLKRAIKRQQHSTGGRNSTHVSPDQVKNSSPIDYYPQHEKLRAPSAPSSAMRARYPANTSLDMSASNDNFKAHDKISNIAANSSVLELTDSVRIRRRIAGIPTANHAHDETLSSSYAMDDTMSSYQSRSLTRTNSDSSIIRGRSKSATWTPEIIRQMQEDEKYSIFKSRYRVPQSIFGFSKPFKNRKGPKPNEREVPFFDKTVHRLRDGFEKTSGRGTFPRASRTLGSEWYPMDVEDANAVKRQGYFHGSFGDITRNSYRVRSANHEKLSSTSTTNMTINTSSNQSYNEGEVTVSPSGSVVLHPKSPDRRAAYGRHMSRLYTSHESLTDDPRYPGPEDQYSDYRKWHPELYQVEYDNRSNNQPPPLPFDIINSTSSSSPQRLDTSSTITQQSSPASSPKKKKSPSRSRPSSPVKISSPSSPSKSKSKLSNSIKSWSDLEHHMTNVQHQSIIPPASILKNKDVIHSRYADDQLQDSMSYDHEPAGVYPMESILSTISEISYHQPTPNIAEDNSDLATYLRWLEDQQKPSTKPDNNKTTAGPSSPSSTQNDESFASRKSPSPGKSKIPRLSPSPEKPWKRYVSSSALSPQQPHNITSSNIRTPQQSNRPPTGIPRSRTKQSTPISADVHPYLLPGEDPTLESKFSSHDLEYTPSHPREAAMKAEMLDVDQTFVSNPLKHLMTPNKS